MQFGIGTSIMGLIMEMITRFFRVEPQSFFLLGPRGTGKSTFVRANFPDALYIDLLQPDLFRSLLARPERLREMVHGNPATPTIVLDEIQKVPQLLDRPEEIGGAAVEGLVAQHLLAWIDHRRPDVALNYWRTRSGNEVDFVLYGKNIFRAIEVKNAATVHSADLRGLKTFGEDYPQAGEAVDLSGKGAVPHRRNPGHAVRGVPSRARISAPGSRTRGI